MPQQQQYDFSKLGADPVFLNMSVQDKIAYLSHVDSTFAKFSNADKAGYINHLMGNDRTGEGRPGTFATVLREGSLGLASGAGLPETTEAFDFSLLPGLKRLFTQPIESAKLLAGGVVEPMAQRLAKGANLIQEGGTRNIIEGGANIAAGAIPIVGPAAFGAGEELGQGIQTGDTAAIAHGAGSAIGTLTTLGVGTKRGQAVAGKTISTVGGGVERGVSAAASGAASVIRETIPNRLMNSVLRTHAGDFNFGKNPGETLVKAGVTGFTEEGLLRNITKEQSRAAKATDSHLSKPAAQVPVDITPAVDAVIDTAKMKARTLGDTAFESRLDSFRDGVLNNNEFGTPVLKPKEIAAVRRTIGESVHWSPDPIETAMKDVRQNVYRALNDTIDAAVPGAKKLTQHEAGLITAKKSLQKAIHNKQGTNIAGLVDYAAAGLGAVLGSPAGPAGVGAGGAFGAATSMAARRALGSTVVKTNVAKILGRQRTP